jgi:hypothetical protein
MVVGPTILGEDAIREPHWSDELHASPTTAYNQAGGLDS